MRYLMILALAFLTGCEIQMGVDSKENAKPATTLSRNAKPEDTTAVPAPDKPPTKTWRVRFVSVERVEYNGRATWYAVMRRPDGSMVNGRFSKPVKVDERACVQLFNGHEPHDEVYICGKGAR